MSIYEQSALYVFLNSSMMDLNTFQSKFYLSILFSLFLVFITDKKNKEENILLYFIATAMFSSCFFVIFQYMHYIQQLQSILYNINISGIMIVVFTMIYMLLFITSKISISRMILYCSAPILLIAVLAIQQTDNFKLGIENITCSGYGCGAFNHYDGLLENIRGLEVETNEMYKSRMFLIQSEELHFYKHEQHYIIAFVIYAMALITSLYMLVKKLIENYRASI